MLQLLIESVLVYWYSPDVVKRQQRNISMLKNVYVSLMLLKKDVTFKLFFHIGLESILSALITLSAINLKIQSTKFQHGISMFCSFSNILL